MKRISTFHFAFLHCGGQVETHASSLLCLHSEELVDFGTQGPHDDARAAHREHLLIGHLSRFFQECS